MRRRAFLSGLSALALSGAAPLWAESPRPLPRPVGGGRASAARIAGSGLSGQVSLALIDPATGLLLEGRGADQPLPPASTLKSLTALFALDRLGGGHRFATRLLATGPVENGQLRGDLILAGGGDPVLDSDDLAALAAELAGAGLRGITGRFRVWQGALPQLDQIAPGQPAHVSYNPAISGIMLNFNRVHLEWRRAAGDYQMALEARARAHHPRAYTISAAPARRAAPIFAYDGSGAREHWSVARGALGRGGSRWLPVRRPALYAGDVFQTLARAQGVGLPAPEPWDAPRLPGGLRVLARHDSPDLRDILRGMLAYSTNLTAEAVGLAGSGAADLAASGAAMRDWLWGQAPLGPAQFSDHSGLSAGSRISPYGMGLALAFAGPGRGLRDILRDQPLTRADGREYQPERFDLRAKTGTLNFVSNLAGYLTTQSGRELVFVIFARDAARRAAAMRSQADLAPGVEGWTRRAKFLQSQLLSDWAARY